ncbi:MULTISPECIES: ABC transporter ATP-binding protein [Brevibacterium]|uniref:Carbohydrate ABC transporter ATP-binding protein, CUT1 family n=2 Tax=Brevibacterium TaxID=1696 RepID=A0A1H1VIH5_BRESA|nr:sn-glycerol-3-phosphate ABC transporter ATP-binding protein UgpC [Brevibacterium sandarakinum]SDS84505.1 carbohydrate ABC transporter ATP-binding protein, CUT1 family [Brevibacterium sandarakinum]
MATVTFDKAMRQYPEALTPSVNEISLDIADGEFLVLVGPSGCGKSTTLRMLAGLEPVDAGHIRIGENDVTGVSPRERDIAMVFQNYALYPHMSVGENMAFALKIAGVAKAERKERVREAAALLDLEPYLDRKPKALSGGQRQRVAMGRAIVRSPQVFLMDEPLSNLDAKLRVQTRAQIASLTRRLGVTTVYVTHDQVEAMTMGDRVAVLADGKLQQVDTPRALYDRPANLFVAGFMGSPAMNLIDLPLQAGALRIGESEFRLSSAQRSQLSGTQVTTGIRPEDFRVESAGGLEVSVDLVEELGADAYVHGRARTATGDIPIVARVNGRTRVSRGDTVNVVPDLSRLHLFDSHSGARLPDEAERAA